MTLSGATAIVTGTSRGFGHATAIALAGAGARVIGVSRSAGPGHGVFTSVTADATDPAVAHDLIEAHRPSILVLNAGATPPIGPVHELSWAEFSRNWQVDVQHAFGWIREALTAPLQPGSTVVSISSGAALRGSPLSGGYAGAKATIRFLTGYAADEATRLGRGIRFLTLLPQLTPATALGAAGVAGYAARQGSDTATFTAALAPILTPEQVGRSVVELATDPAARGGYLLSGHGLAPAP